MGGESKRTPTDLPRSIVGIYQRVVDTELTTFRDKKSDGEALSSSSGSSRFSTSHSKIPWRRNLKLGAP